MSYTKDFHGAEYIIVDDLKELVKLKGSKYIEVNNNNIFTKVKKMINDDKKVLFFGLPCVVAALYSFLGERPHNLITCELICNGPTYSKVHSDYIGYLEKKYKSKIVKFSVRYKKDSWTPLFLYAEFENGKIFKKPFYDTEYGFGFNLLARPQCYNCKFTGDNRHGDLMIGDFWGATEKDDYWNKYGVSSIFVETTKGEEYIKAIADKVKLFPTNFEEAVKNNLRVINSRKKYDDRDNFLTLLNEKDLFYAVRHTITNKEKIKKIIKKLFPQKIINRIIKIFGIKKK